MSTRNSGRKRLFDSAPSDACPAYMNVRDGEKDFLRKAREDCEDLWTQFEPYADRHFLDEFPRQFHQRWFEMDLTVSLIRSDFDVHCPKPGPDILLNLDGRRVWIEAVCASPGEEGKADSVPKPQTNAWTRVPMKECALRVANSLDVKARQFRKHLQNGTVSCGDLLVVAINTYLLGEWPYADDYMKMALYGAGDLVLLISRDTKRVVDSYHKEIENIRKASGALVGIQPFFDGNMRHISSVWAFQVDPAIRPFRLETTFIQYPDLECSNPWPQGAISLGQEWCFQESQGGWKGIKR